MMRPSISAGMSALVVLACSACAASGSAVAAAISQTEGARALEALALTATAAAEATDTPLPTATTTLTPTSTSTPAPTLTPTPPPGMAYVPDFIGMDLPDAEAIVIELGFRWFYVAVVNRDVPEWQVFDQSPDPGSLIALDGERVRLFAAVEAFTPTPVPEPRGGSTSGDACGGVTYQGYCDGNVVVWCEGGQLWWYDCASCGGYCMWFDPDFGCGCACP